jgi:hypothetical protein
VAGIALNAADQVLLDTVTVHSTRHDVPANGRLSAAIFLLQAVSQHLTTVDSVALGGEAAAISTAQTNLRAALFNFLDSNTDTITHSNGVGLFSSATNGIPGKGLL